MDNQRNIKTYFQGEWHDGNYPILGAADHATWLGTLVFDGARRMFGTLPDLELNCQRILHSAHAMGLNPAQSWQEIYDITLDGLKLIPEEIDLYIRPMMWSVDYGSGIINPDPDSVGFAICLEEMAMPRQIQTMKLALSPFKRPTLETAIANAKAASLYANSGRIIADARRRGFHNAIVRDANGNVAETGSTNIFIVKDGVVKTPIPNGSFLAGLTRARCMKLLDSMGHEVEETTLTIEDIHDADELFSTANLSKIVPVTHFEDTKLPSIELGSQLRQTYIDWALSEKS